MGVASRPGNTINYHFQSVAGISASFNDLHSIPC